MNVGKIVYFRYDSIIPCQKGRIEEVVEDESRKVIAYDIRWLSEDNQGIGTSQVPTEDVFATKKECMNHDESLQKEIKDQLRNKLKTKEDVLKFMYDSIHSEDYDWSSEKSLLKEKIKELFDVSI